MSPWGKPPEQSMTIAIVGASAARSCYSVAFLCFGME